MSVRKSTSSACPPAAFQQNCGAVFRPKRDEPMYADAHRASDLHAPVLVGVCRRSAPLPATIRAQPCQCARHRRFRRADEAVERDSPRPAIRGVAPVAAGACRRRSLRPQSRQPGLHRQAEGGDSVAADRPGDRRAQSATASQGTISPRSRSTTRCAASIRAALGALTLLSPDRATRLAAADTMLEDADAANRSSCSTQRSPARPTAKVKAAMEAGPRRRRC